MHFFAASSSSSSKAASFNLLASSKNPNNKKYINPTSFKIPITKTTPSIIPFSSKQSSPLLDQRPQLSSLSRNREPIKETEKDTFEGLLVVRRPAAEGSTENSSQGNADDSADEKKSSAIIDAGLEKFAKKMPIFEPERLEIGFSSSQGKPLTVNLDLALYKANLLARSYRYAEAELILEKCINYWPEDGRAYVASGKILIKQSKTAEARAVYEKGCQATQGENAYIWQCWAVLENKMGNIRRARELFDAATVADKGHIAAWHGWAVLELKQGNVKKARQLLAKGIKFCGGNEYIYQTLALLEAKANRYEQARYLFRQATKCNPKSCASWLAWAQVEMQQENNVTARQLFQKAVQASPKNRFAWHVWGVFEANIGNIEMARKLLKIGHTLNPRDPVLLQSLALLEYKHSTANLARVLFRKASELDPKHQPVWIAWGWMEWKEGNISNARELYQRALSIDSTSESAAKCLQVIPICSMHKKIIYNDAAASCSCLTIRILWQCNLRQAWGVLEQRIGNLSLARRLFRSSLSINSQSYITWMTWAQFEEDQGNAVRAEEIRNLYFQQRTEVVDDASWVMGVLDIIDPALDSIKRLLNLDQSKEQETFRNKSGQVETKADGPASNSDGNVLKTGSGFDLDSFMKERLSLDPSKLEVELQTSRNPAPWRASQRRLWRSPTKLSKARN